MGCYKRIRQRAWKAMTLNGIRPHPRTGVLWLRLRTPTRLIKRRRDHEALGIKFKVEHHRSLGTRDRRQAQAAYAAKRNEIEEIWKSWEECLAKGAQRLSSRNIVALAGEHARAHFRRHEDNPFDAPVQPPLPTTVEVEVVADVLKDVSPTERREYAAYMQRLSQQDGTELLDGVWESLQKFPFQ